MKKIMLEFFSLLVLLGFGLWFLLTQPFIRPANAPPEVAVSAERLARHVRMLAGELPPRGHDNIEGLQRSAEYIWNMFAASGGRVSEQSFLVEGQIHKNIRLELGPETGERLIVGAHYDTAHGLPGADDNASGVAGLLELAGILGRHPPATKVELVAFTLEEPPYFRTRYMGSSVHATWLAQQGLKPRLMLALEMIGYFRDEPGSQQYPPLVNFLYPDQGNFIALVSYFGQFSLTRKAKRAMRAASDLPVYSINAPRLLPGVDFSDHANYWDHDYPALMITDTAFYRNPHYHRAGDTPDTLDYGRMAQVVLGVYGILRAFGA